jgi:probable HAF family extracellular repeat protein
MRSTQMRLALAVTLLALPMCVAAQTSSSPVIHHTYTLIDMGTFGGPQTYPDINFSVQTLSAGGVLAGCSETALPNPKYPNGNPFLFPPPEPDPYIVHAFKYSNGIVTDLGALPGANSSCAFWTSDNGLIAGASENGQIDPLTGWPEIEAVLWRNGQMIPLGTLGGYESFPVSINNRGQVTGIATNAVPDDLFGFGTQVRAFLWQGGVMRDIGTLGGPDAYGIIVNDRGRVLGFSLTADLGGDAFLWQNGAFTDIPDMIGGTEINPFFMNNQAMVIGNASVVDDQVFHPFFWQNGVMHDIGTFGGTDGEAVWVNQNGQVVGTANFAGDAIHHAFLWQNGTLTDLVPAPAYDWSGASSINSLGQAVGFSADSQTHQALAPMLWEGGEAIDVSTLTNVPPNMYIAGAININDRGEISAVGVVDHAYLHALLLVPHGICDGNCQNRIAASKSGKANAAAKSAAGFSDPYADGSRRHSAMARLLRNRGR